MSGRLRRELGLGGATLLGLGSVLGTGVFVSVGLAAGAAGPMAPAAILVAGLIALCSGLSSASLAAASPVSGGTYEYASARLSPWAGFAAGWMFLCAKSASAATAALGVASYGLGWAGADAGWRTPAALGVIGVVTGTAALGVRRSAQANAVIVAAALGALAHLAASAAASAVRGAPEHWSAGWPGAAGLLEASGLMFVAFAGFARVATLGEEVRDPARTIPRAVVLTLACAGSVYTVIATVSVSAIGADAFAKAAASGAPLAAVARAVGAPAGAAVLAVGASAAMLGVLLNLVLGLSRVLLAMARRGDMPRGLAHVGERSGSPWPATAAAGIVIATIALMGDLAFAWSLSAFSVLVYYGLTNASALRLPRSSRRAPRWTSWAGLAGCVVLAPTLEASASATGVGLLGLGVAWRLVMRTRRG